MIIDIFSNVSLYCNGRELENFSDSNIEITSETISLILLKIFLYNIFLINRKESSTLLKELL